MVAVEVAATVFAVTVKFTDEAPAATVMLAGTVATAVFELERLTTMPPAGAMALSRTVPVTVVATSAAGADRVSPLKAVEGVTLKAAVFVSAPRVAERVTVWMLETGSVEAVMPAAEAPWGTVTAAGRVATDMFELTSETSVPPAGAGPLSVTEPSSLDPPVTFEGLTARDESV